MGNAVTLHSACAGRDLPAVKKLLETSTSEDLEMVDDCGRTPLMLAVAAMQRRLEEEDEFGSFDTNGEVADESDDEPGNAVVIAQQEGEAEDADDEAEPIEDVDGEGPPPPPPDVAPISKEAEILHLLMRHQVNVDHQDEDGRTALHLACAAQTVVGVRMLVHAGARPIRDNYGLLPQDFIMRNNVPEWDDHVNDIKELLDEITEKLPYSIKLLAFRPSGIVQLDMGAQVEKGSLVTVEFDVPENHSPKDYVQVLVSREGSLDIEMGSNHEVPAGPHGQITISTESISSSSTVRFVYIKTDINKMSRKVVASGCNATLQASVGEIFQFELHLYERVVEVESIPDFEFLDQPLIVLKRIGILLEENNIEWVDIRGGNHIVAVNDIRIDTMTFADAVRVLQENNGKMCTKLLMQNYSACGDFIPEKILGVGVVDKFAYLHPVERDEKVTESAAVSENSLEEFVKTEEVVPSVAPPAEPLSDVSEPSNDTVAAPPAEARQEVASPVTYQRDWEGTMDPSADSLEIPPPSTIQAPADNLSTHFDCKLAIDISDDPAVNDAIDDKISAASTIETVVPIENSRQLIEQLQMGISKAVH